MSLAVKALLASLREGQTLRWTVRGASMWPVIPDGSEIEVSPCTEAPLRVGEIGAFHRRGTIVVHRVIAARGGALRFRGDSLLRDDGEVEASEVLGRVRVIRRARPRWTPPRLPKLLGAARAALEWLRSLRPP